MLPIHSYQRADVGSRLINCYAEQSPVNAKGPVALVGAPGVTNWVTVGVGPIRGMTAFNDVLHVVSGGELYSVTSSGVATKLGDIPGSRNVLMASNRTQLVIVSDSATYVYDGTLAQITDPDYLGATGIGFLDGFLLFIEPNSDRFYSSDLNDATSYDALNFATAEGAPDKLVGIIVDHQQIILAGKETTEIWWNAGLTGFPFERTPQGVIETGCAAGLSLAKADNSVFWLDDDLIVRALRDLTPTRVSQHGVEEAIAGYSRVDDARAFTFTEGGHIFYVLTFPTAQATWVYDITTQEWHERQSLGRTRWLVDHYARANNQHIVAKLDSNQLGIMSADVYTEFGEELPMIWSYPNVYASGLNQSHRMVELIARRGVGGSVLDPQVTLDISDDGGRTFRTISTRTLGKVGEYRARARWLRLGRSRDRVYRMRLSDDARRYIEHTEVAYE